LLSACWYLPWPVESEVWGRQLSYERCRKLTPTGWIGPVKTATVAVVTFVCGDKKLASKQFFKRTTTSQPGKLCQSVTQPSKVIFCCQRNYLGQITLMIEHMSVQHVV